MARTLSNASTSMNVARPVRAAVGALTTTIAVSVPVFLLGMGGDLTPAIH